MSEIKGRINCYNCPEGHGTVTVNVDDGVTPMMLGCRHKGCKKMAVSMMYQVPQFIEPDWEWYKPTTVQAKRADRKNPGMLNHAENGGLFLRRKMVTT